MIPDQKALRDLEAALPRLLRRRRGGMCTRLRLSVGSVDVVILWR